MHTPTVSCSIGANQIRAMVFASCRLSAALGVRSVLARTLRRLQARRRCLRLAIVVNSACWAEHGTVESRARK